jgi:hypothetical protein
MTVHRPKCYISGPITGIEPKVYIRAFYRASRMVEALGYEAVNPCELNHADHDQTWASFMRIDIKAMMDCEAILLLRGWHRSTGANTEYYLAQVLGMKALQQDELEHPERYDTEPAPMNDHWGI